MECSSPPSFAIEAIFWIKYRVYHSSHVTRRRLAGPALSSCRCSVLRLVLPSLSAQRMQPHCNGRCQTHPRKRTLVGCVQHSMQARGAFVPPPLTLTNTSLTCCLLQKETDTFKDLMLGTGTACTVILTSWCMGRKFWCFGQTTVGDSTGLPEQMSKESSLFVTNSDKGDISRTRWPKLGLPMRLRLQFRVSFLTV